MAEGLDIPGFDPGVHIRPETTADYRAIADLTTRAFAPMPFSDGDEADVIGRLRAAGALTLSLLAETDGRIVGHVAFSPMVGDPRWFALGPVSVVRERQRQGIGSLLIRAGLQMLREKKAKGCALVGDPNYYGRFGFEPMPTMAPRGEPAEYFQLLRFGTAWPMAPMDFDPSFHGPAGG